MSFLISGLSGEEYKAYLNPASLERHNWPLSPCPTVLNALCCSTLIVMINRIAFFLLHRFAAYPNNVYLFQKFQSYEFSQIENQQQYDSVKEIFACFMLCPGLSPAKLEKVNASLNDAKERLQKEANRLADERISEEEIENSNEENSNDEVLPNVEELQNIKKNEELISHQEEERHVERKSLELPVNPPLLEKRADNKVTEHILADTTSKQKIGEQPALHDDKQNTSQSPKKPVDEPLKEQKVDEMAYPHAEKVTANQSSEKPVDQPVQENVENEAPLDIDDHAERTSAKNPADDLLKEEKRKDDKSLGTDEHIEGKSPELPVVEPLKEEKVIGGTPSPIDEARIKRETKLTHLLQEISTVEQNFFHNATIIGTIFAKLKDNYPAEKLVEEYDKSIQLALPHFENINERLRTIDQNSTLSLADKVLQVTTLYCANEDKSYYHSLSNLMLLYSQFMKWGSTAKCEELARRNKLLPPDILIGIDGKYNPIIFLQRLTQLSTVLQELIKHSEDPNVKAHDHAIQEIVTEINEKKREAEKKEIIEEISSLLHQTSEPADAQKRASKLFIENRLYVQPGLNHLHQEIRTYYASHFASILPDLFKEVEKLKLAAKFKKLELVKLKECLAHYLEYSQDDYVGPIANFKPWQTLAEAILADDGLTHATLKLCLKENQKKGDLLLMRCVVDLLKQMNKKGDDKIISESQQVAELIQHEIKARKINLNAKKRSQVKALLNDLKALQKSRTNDSKHSES